MARVTAKKAPAIMKSENMFCAGCGHSIFDRILGEVLTEMDIIGDTIVCSDIGCNHQFQYSMAVDVIVPPHGKMGAALTAMKRVRPDKYCLTIAGDGGAYAIGLGERYFLRNEQYLLRHDGRTARADNTDRTVVFIDTARAYGRRTRTGF